MARRLALICFSLLLAAPVSVPQVIPLQVGRLITDAKAADSQEGNYRYARRLAEWFVTSQTGDAYRDSFSRRLSSADLLARHDEREWIPESVVAQAYNDLLKQISGHAGDSLRTDARVVHQLRIILWKVSPAFSTVNSHSSECLPTEAVLLMYELLAHNGSAEGPCPHQQNPCVMKVDAIVLMSKYARSHSAAGQQKPFDHVAKLFGM